MIRQTAWMDPKAHRLREGSWHKLWTVVFTHSRGPLSSPPTSLTPGWSQPCLFPSVIRFMMGKAGFPQPSRHLSSACP